jgi:hypothetical protein
VKALFIPESAHSPIFEEPEKAIRIMLEDVLAGKTHLGDIKQSD